MAVVAGDGFRARLPPAGPVRRGLQGGLRDGRGLPLPQHLHAERECTLLPSSGPVDGCGGGIRIAGRFSDEFVPLFALCNDVAVVNPR